MNENVTTTLLAASGLFVVLGRWAKGQKISIELVVGITVLGIFLSLLTAMNESLGKAFTVLILMAIIYEYAPAIIKKLGIAD